jgi:hypothetical protein
MMNRYISDRSFAGFFSGSILQQRHVHVIDRKLHVSND